MNEDSADSCGLWPLFTEHAGTYPDGYEKRIRGQTLMKLRFVFDNLVSARFSSRVAIRDL